MKMYEALQSNIGQHMAGVQLPLTDAEVPIPFVDYNFDNKLMLAAGIGVGAYGVVKTLRHQDRTRQLNDSIQYPAGSDFAESTRKTRNKGRAKDLGLGLLAAFGITSGVLALSGPYSEKTINEVDSVAVLIRADNGAYPEDVRVGEELDSRLDSAVNVVKQMDLSGISVEFIAVGTEPLSMGILENGNGKNEIVNNFKQYSSVLSNRGSKNNGADFESALAMANDAKKVIVFGNLEGNDQTPVLDGEDELSNRVSTIELGVAGTTLNDFGQTVEAPYNPAFNALVVGAEDSYTASSDSEIRDVVNGIINDQIQTVERSDIEFFDKVAVTSLALLGVGSYLRFGKKSKSNTPKKGK
jgi:hypothetical protein